jgi:hypothetical protein
VSTVKVPFPLNTSELAYLELPGRPLTKTEADRLTKMIWALVVDKLPEPSK